MRQQVIIRLELQKIQRPVNCVYAFGEGQGLIILPLHPVASAGKFPGGYDSITHVLNFQKACLGLCICKKDFIILQDGP